MMREQNVFTYISFQLLNIINDSILTIAPALASPALPAPVKTEAIKPATKMSSVITAPVTKPAAKGMFDDDADDDMFATKPAVVPAASSVVAAPKAVAKSKSPFDDDDEEDLFGAAKPAPVLKLDKGLESSSSTDDARAQATASKSQASAVKASSPLADSDDEKPKPVIKAEPVKPAVVQPAVLPSKPKSKGPFDDDDDDDLFSQPPKITPPAKISVVKSEPVAKPAKPATPAPEDEEEAAEVLLCFLCIA
jgi:hypothetical protein